MTAQQFYEIAQSAEISDAWDGMAWEYLPQRVQRRIEVALAAHPANDLRLSLLIAENRSLHHERNKLLADLAARAFACDPLGLVDHAAVRLEKAKEWMNKKRGERALVEFMKGQCSPTTPDGAPVGCLALEGAEIDRIIIGALGPYTPPADGDLMAGAPNPT